MANLRASRSTMSTGDWSEWSDWDDRDRNQWEHWQDGWQGGWQGAVKGDGKSKGKGEGPVETMGGCKVDDQGDGKCIGKGDGKAKGMGVGGGKGKSNGKGGKGKLRLWNYQPNSGDKFYFKTHDHAFYDDFPDGIEVSADSYQVDYHAPISVISARAATKNTYHHGLGNRVFRYVAVSFRSGSGDIIWTNFSRNGFVWMVPLSEPRCFHT